MIHFTCDCCSKKLASGDLRYLVKIECHAAIETTSETAQADRDHLMEVHEILEQLEVDEDPEIAADVYQKQAFDLCPDCYRRFQKDPLANHRPLSIPFSSN